MRRNTIAATDCLLKLLTRASGCSLSDPILRQIDNEHRLVAEWPVSLASQAFEQGLNSTQQRCSKLCCATIRIGIVLPH